MLPVVTVKPSAAHTGGSYRALVKPRHHGGEQGQGGCSAPLSVLAWAVGTLLASICRSRDCPGCPDSRWGKRENPEIGDFAGLEKSSTSRLR